MVRKYKKRVIFILILLLGVSVSGLCHRHGRQVVFANGVENYNNLGVVLAKTEKYDEAISAFKQTINLKPNHFYAYRNLGLIYAQKQKYEEAIYYWKKLSKLNPTDALIFYNLGVAFHNLNRLDSAIYYYQKAIDRKSQLTAARNNIAQAYIQKATGKEMNPSQRNSFQLQFKLKPIINLLQIDFK